MNKTASEIMQLQPKLIGLVAGGGFLGANARYIVGLIIPTPLLATGISNVVGCFFLGLIMLDSRSQNYISKRFRLLLGTGFISSFTTYSAFALQIVSTQPVTAVAYIVTSYTLGFGAIFASWFFIQTQSDSSTTELWSK